MAWRKRRRHGCGKIEKVWRLFDSQSNLQVGECWHYSYVGVGIPHREFVERGRGREPIKERLLLPSFTSHLNFLSSIVIFFYSGVFSSCPWFFPERVFHVNFCVHPISFICCLLYSVGVLLPNSGIRARFFQSMLCGCSIV